MAADTVTWAAADAVTIMDGTGAVAITRAGAIIAITTAGENSLPFAFAIHCPGDARMAAARSAAPRKRGRFSLCCDSVFAESRGVQPSPISTAIRIRSE